MNVHVMPELSVGPAFFEQPVSRHLVHRAAVSEVMITGWRSLDEKTSLLAAQWPRTHSFYRPVGGCHDPLLIAETVRQAGLVVSHAELDCPLDRRFLLWDLSYEAGLGDLTVGWGPTNLVLRFTRSEVRHRGTTLAGLRGHVDLYRDGELIGMGEGRFDCVSRAAYDRLRATSSRRTPAASPPDSGIPAASLADPGIATAPPPGPGFVAASLADPGIAAASPPDPGIAAASLRGPGIVAASQAGPGIAAASLRGPGIVAASLAEPVDPALVGRDRPEDVVLAQGSPDGGWPLRVDPAHPVLFDHEVDHVPGMALMEAMRQAALLVTHPVPVVPAKMYATFRRYVELTDPCQVHAHPEAPLPGGEVPVRVSIDQYGTPASTGLIITRPT
ncbi:AfsA-related hotdog domain-containing protein [Sphaerisporangium fuscum]|uniref:AfsA-related hotdog domain-containing protein n=1 Tax=Sphaerisporangium fuscum TaxID=2835868 RepID=UPI001BDC37DB|nr:AfsA-related hotdog domain-containing protein [Sphaerisporangium fuscum]